MSDDPMQRAVMVPDEVLFQRLPDGEAVFLNLQTEQYYGLDATATRMWEALAASDTIAEAHARLVEVFDADGEMIARDLLKLVERLTERGLLVVDRA